MQVTDVRVRRVEKEGKMKAIVSITLDNEFVIHDIKVIEGEKGLFIAMPSRKAADGEYRDIAHPINSNTRDMIQTIILNKYETTLLENEAAEEGDPYAKEILAEAAHHLAALIRDIGYALDLKETEPDFKLGLWGSCILKSPQIFEELKNEISRDFPDARICLPEKEAIDGAVELALSRYMTENTITVMRDMLH